MAAAPSPIDEAGLRLGEPLLLSLQSQPRLVKQSLYPDQAIPYTKCNTYKIDSAFDGDEDCIPMTSR